VILLSIPFLLTGNFSSYARSLFLPGQAPTYQTPLVFAFSGSGALLTYLHDAFGWETSGVLPFTVPIMVIAILAVMVLSYRRAITPAQGALAGYSYRLNSSDFAGLCLRILCFSAHVPFPRLCSLRFSPVERFKRGEKPLLGGWEVRDRFKTGRGSHIISLYKPAIILYSSLEKSHVVSGTTRNLGYFTPGASLPALHRAKGG
jgi:hypothetical protein